MKFNLIFLKLNLYRINSKVLGIKRKSVGFVFLDKILELIIGICNLDNF